jgi:digeranylgeranylglycerophospholipid reductase
LVIGGGASGIWAAIAASGEGARTGLVERNARIGDHIVCAEGVRVDALARFVKVRPEWVAARIDGVRLFAPDGNVVEIEEPGTGFILNKDLFLRGLAEMAAARGVEMHVGIEATNVRPASSGDLEVSLASPSHPAGSVVRCGAVVAADGLESRIGREVGLSGALGPAEIFLCAQYTVSPIELNPHLAEFHFGRDVAPGGYAWVFPKGDSTANLGVGIARQGAARGQRGAASPMYLLRRFRERRAPKSQVLGRVVGGVPAEGEPYKACGKGVFLAGDAARVADPVTGAGIVTGMASGKLGGVFAARYAKGSERPQRLEQEFAKALKAEFRDRKLRWAVRKVLLGMSDRDLSRMVESIGDYARRGASLRSGPATLLKFMAKSMPTTFRLARHLLGG